MSSVITVTRRVSDDTEMVLVVEYPDADAAVAELDGVLRKVDEAGSRARWLVEYSTDDGDAKWQVQESAPADRSPVQIVKLTGLDGLSGNHGERIDMERVQALALSHGLQRPSLTWLQNWLRRGLSIQDLEYAVVASAKRKLGFGDICLALVHAYGEQAGPEGAA